jgi:hypothetical protein
MSVKVSIQVEAPNELFQKFLQHIRDFDTQHEDHALFFQIFMSGDLSVEEGERVMRSIQPPFDHVFKHKVGKPV